MCSALLLFTWPTFTAHALLKITYIPILHGMYCLYIIWEYIYSFISYYIMWRILHSVLRTDVRLISQKAPTVSVQPSIVNSLTWDISDTTLTVSSIKAGSIYLGVPNKQAHLEINKLLWLTILSLYYMYELLYFNV